MSTSPDLSQDFATLTVETTYEAIPEAARERAKQSIMDTLGVIIAASALSPSVKPVIELSQEIGGREEASILGFEGRKVPALTAAFANGAMAHCLDYDDHAPEGHHPSSAIIPATFALAERAGGISGREMIAATAIGQDIFLRLRRNVPWKQDWHLTPVIGVFSTTAAAARVMGLNHAQVVGALGIAGSQAAGTMELGYGVGSDLRGMYAGFSAKQAVLSALMAERGVIGPGSIFEGKAGFFRTYFGGEYDRGGILKDIGRDYTGDSILFKAWPSCGMSHSYIHAMTGLMQAHDLRHEDIREIKVHVGDFAQTLCTPIEKRRAPTGPMDAKFSIPWCIALAAVRQTVQLGDFTDAALKDPEVLAVAAKVVPVPDPSANWSAKLPYGRVEVTMADGRSFERIGDNVPGEAEAPLGWDALIAKFSEAASFSQKPVASAAIGRVRDLIRELEHVDDASEVIRALYAAG